MEQVRKSPRKTNDESFEDAQHESQVRSDLPDTDALLEEIDDLLAEEEATEEERLAAARAAYREKLRSINFIGRTPDPCAQVIRVPDSAVESYLRSGMFEVANCGDC